MIRDDYYVHFIWERGAVTHGRRLDELMGTGHT